MKMNFKGLVALHNLPISLPLLPLYEAVVNSIQSIEDAGIDNGKIEIVIDRDQQMNLFNDWETDIENITIVDNGIGFTDENFNSFDTYASEYKLQKGCKGVGRMLWLKAFCDVEIDSVFYKDRKAFERKFLFDTNKEVHDVVCSEMDIEREATTTIKLKSLRSQYKSTCPKKLDTIAKNILNHCFAYYVMGKAPKIIISDAHDTIDLTEMYKNNMGGNINVIKTEIKGNEFTIIHSKNYMNPNDKHEVNFCANQRVVLPNNLSKWFINLNTRLADKNGEFTYTGYVMSDILDKYVNRERTKFEMPEQSNMVNLIGFNDIVDSVKETIEDF